MDRQVHILWEGTQFAEHSFAVVNRHHCWNLLDWPGIQLTLIPYEPDQFSPSGDTALERLRNHDVRQVGLDLPGRAKRPHLWVKHTWPPRTKPPGKDPWVIMLPWEYSQLPVRYVEILNTATEIWTPSRFSAGALVASGVQRPVVVVPNGVDTRVYNSHSKRYPAMPTDKFTFLYVGGTIYRKGIDLLLDAYSTTFSDSDPVSLVIKDSGTKTLYRGQTAERLVRDHQARSGTPEIRYLDQSMTPNDLAALYRSADVVVSPYRGEGFSLPTLEAMACGTPVVVTDGGATDDFVDEDTGWRIPSTRVSIGSSVYGDATKVEAFLLEPKLDALSATMLSAYRESAEVERKGRRAAEAAQAWSWLQATTKLVARVDSICGTHLLQNAQNGHQRPGG